VGEKQKYLKWRFSLPKELFYNFNPIAGSSLGYKHTEETRAKMSEAKSGANHPLFGKTHSPESKASEGRSSNSKSGNNHPNPPPACTYYKRGGCWVNHIRRRLGPKCQRLTPVKLFQLIHEPKSQRQCLEPIILCMDVQEH